MWNVLLLCTLRLITIEYTKIFNDTIYVVGVTVGGYRHRMLDECERYDVATDTCEQIADLLPGDFHEEDDAANQPGWCKCAAALGIDGKLWVGGYHLECLPTFDVFDPASGTWVASGGAGGICRPGGPGTFLPC